MRRGWGAIGVWVSLAAAGALGAPAGAAPGAAPSPAAVLQELVAAAPAGPDGRPLFPADLQVVWAQGDALRVTGDFDADPTRQALRMEHWVGALSAAGVTGGARLQVSDGAGGWRPLGGVDLTPAPPRTPAAPAPPRLALGRPIGRGVLAGRRIALSAGHGWVSDGAGGWRTQRSRWAFEGCGACRGITEDFFTAEVVSHLLIPLLQQAGATVITAREPDHDLAAPLIIDDGDPAYSEQGPWVAGNNPGGFRDDYRVLPAGAEGSARFDLSGAPGVRRVALRWRDGGNRTGAAQVWIDHAAGRTTLTIDQRRMGRLWLDLGTYTLNARSALTVGPGPDGVLIADAVKVGGGRHPEAEHPWWQMAALLYVSAAGADDGVLAGNDVTIRPRYAEYGDADVYLSIHANASGQPGGSRANGLSTYRYSCQRYGDHSPAGAAVDCDDPPGSAALTEGVHAAMLERLRLDWDPGYGDRGARVANFGELRDLEGAPGVLIETGFFDNLADPSGGAAQPDNRSLHDPRWREAFAAGLVTGLARYFDPTAPALPGRPEGLWARNQADGTLALSWAAVPGATGYRVFISSAGRAQDDGVPTPGPRYVTAGLTPGRIYTLRVAAENRTGQGLASQAVAVRFRGARLAEGVAPADALLLYGYDRRDARVQRQDNDLRYAVEHGDGLGAVEGLYFDGALDEAVEAGDVALGAYGLVDLAVGKDSTADDAVSAAMRGLLGAYLDGGGRVILSGEEIGWDLVERSDDPDEAAWLAARFGAEYVADDADTFALSGVGVFAGVGDAALDDGSAGTYEVRYPDVWAAVGDGALAFAWPDGTGAAVATPQTVLFGAGLEAVIPAEARRAIFAAAVGWLGLPVAPGDLDLDGAPDGCERRFGFDDRDGADGDADPDGDGRGLAQECAEGTDPTVADEVAPDAGPDAAALDGAVDADVVDASPLDAGLPPDQALGDSALPDEGAPDQAIPDAAAPDQAVLDAAPVWADLGAPDAGRRFDGGISVAQARDDGGCHAAPGGRPGAPLWGWLAGALALGLSRRRGPRPPRAGGRPRRR